MKLSNNERKSNEDGSISRKNKLLRELFGFIKVFILATVFTSIILFFISINFVNGDSMYPTLHDGDRFISLNTKINSEIKRGDIVVVELNNSNKYIMEDKLVKRVIGLPGDTIKIDDGKVFINGKEYKEKYKRDKKAERRSLDIIQLELKESQYFIMGDNRNHSSDSRLFGPIDISEIKSKYLFEF
ncbi:signal peptidase I [[Clostridium] innocuum]|uniref:signal peptidase I n=1 Tax=Clostridium innocuum TaxID=1522 RepID=UPI000D6D7E9F|nr:signal peptidase I [[Clostridium] innocuum]MCR0315260.1 signal peptidase I [[Clostridium] innocuum]MCR0369718.1 signal peptidase I [[Clostridium] innocuum]MCR0374771.1 signal peptidase I [[Clostridium] innocuum]MCR0559671.1 signal peptidase I [[Clostridium] innocuum]MCR0602635.1 signal peptidase I [[Clostridium] innocuum]